MRLKWSEYARYKYSEQINHIALRNPTAAAKIASAVEETLERLLLFPRMGHIGRYSGTFEFSVKKAPLIVVYEIREEILIVLNIVHMAQDYP
jgi:plasmid stabilization system protein ParE